MTNPLPTTSPLAAASTATATTGEHAVYVQQGQTRTYEVAPTEPNDTPRDSSLERVDVVVLTAPQTATYVQTKVDVTLQAIRRVIAALNEELRQRV